MKMILSAAAFAGLTAVAGLATVAGATPVTDAIRQDLAAQGYTHIEMVQTSAGIRVEARNQLTEMHQLYDAATGDLLSSRAESRGNATDPTASLGMDDDGANGESAESEHAGGTDDGEGHDSGSDGSGDHESGDHESGDHGGSEGADD